MQASAMNSSSVVDLEFDAYDAMLQHIYTQVQSGNNHILNEDDPISTGVCLRTDDGFYRMHPPDDPALDPFREAVIGLKAVVAVKLHNASVSAALSLIGPNEYSMFVGDDTRVQVLDTLGDLPLADKEQCAAFIRDEHVLVLWAEQVSDLLPLYTDFEDLLLKLVMSHWRSRVNAGFALPISHGGSPAATRAQSMAISRGTSGYGSQVLLHSNSITDPEVEDETGDATGASAPGFASALNRDVASGSGNATGAGGNPDSQPAKKKWFSKKSKAAVSVVPVPDGTDVEVGNKTSRRRPTQLHAPVYGGLATGLTIFFIGCGVNTLVQEMMLDGGFIRFALLASAPFVFCVALFFSCQFVSNIFFCIGPVKQYHENSKYYSAKPPEVDPNDPSPELPHVTIQMPVYKESLPLTIAPSVESLKRAMLTYARQGGTSSIFICDDGLQLLSEEDRNARIEYYENHGIGWVSRPKHNGEPGGYKRAGRFKKASNLNFGLSLSMSMERHILRLHAEEPNCHNVEERALALALEERNAELDQQFYQPLLVKVEAENAKLEPQAVQLVEEKPGKKAKKGKDNKPKTVAKVEAWAKNARAIRLGEVILLVDSDTQVPHDCLRDAALELRESPQVAIIQHESDVMQVAHHWFENGIAHFTRRINRCISMGCANGEVAPFVGHNAFLRWKAIQDVAFVDTDDGVTKIWSESNVSEDFDMALRLQLKGYIIRWATYSNGGFKEGVSLTVDDELNRWQKYAYGCSELMFQPFILWFKRGPLQKRFHQFVWSTVPLHSKLTTLSYIFSYYGIAGAIMLSIINYILVGFTLGVDGFYVHSWEVWLSCTVVFIGMGNVAFTLLEYRLGKETLLKGTWTTIKWIPFFFFFFGGLSFPLTTALLSHLFSYNIQWSATIKEVEISNFFVEIPRILKLFWRSFLMSFLVIATVVVMSTDLIPKGWRIVDYAVIFPLALTAGAHLLFPIVLNPWLMVFSY